MKRKYFERQIGFTFAREIVFVLPLLMRSVVNGEEADPTPIDVEDIKNLCVRVRGVGETGKGRIIGTTGSTRYELGESQIIVHVLPENGKTGDIDVNIGGMYGQVCLRAEMVAAVDGGARYEFNGSDLVFDVVAAGGGGDYKTDVYMDGDGRVVVERGEDGSTMILDEHENPILKRNADGSTQYFDAYQSARLMIDAHGNVSLNYTEDETVKTLQLAEAILARTSKHLLYNTAGETTIKDADGNVLTHAQIYAMLMSTPDFVVLVRSDHAFHPNLVTPTQIAFTCTYLGTNGLISTERVNITDANVVTYTSGKGIARNANGGLVLGDLSEASGYNSMALGYECKATGRETMAQGYGCKATRNQSHAEGIGTEASGEKSHSEGESTKATGLGSHAEGRNTISKGAASHAEGFYTSTNSERSHAEGTNCNTNAGTSHAEGNYCETGTNGGSAHAEGSYTNANGAASHAEGYRTVTTEGGQHAQGCWNKSEGGLYSFMHGCGTDADNRANAFLIAGTEVYMYGIGGYDGTNYGTEGVKSVQTVIRELQLKLVNF